MVFPEPQVERNTAPVGSFFGDADYGRYFHRFFSRLEELLEYGNQQREKILQETLEWQAPILISSLPKWLQFKIINSAYVIYTNSILNKAGLFTSLEGGMGGLTGTMDQRMVTHPFYQKFYPSLDRIERKLFERTQGKKGNILHFSGHYYVGLPTSDGDTPTRGNFMTDNTTAWVIQQASDLAATGDKDIARSSLPAVKAAMNYLRSRLQSKVPLPDGPTTYDDYQHPPLTSYLAGAYLASLRACSYYADVLSEDVLKNECQQQFEISQKAFVNLLWNGRFFAHGCNRKGNRCRNDTVFSGQLAGQFLSRFYGFGDIVDLDKVRSSLKIQFTTSLQNSPNFYAPKVWSLTKNSGLDQRGSRCWPFYLESYTAFPAI